MRPGGREEREGPDDGEWRFRGAPSALAGWKAGARVEPCASLGQRSSAYLGVSPWFAIF
jgi:hypothetical protein